MSKPSIRRTLSATLALALGLAACAGPATPAAPTTGDEKVTLTVWD